MIDRKTPNLQLPLPDPSNQLSDDVLRLAAALNQIDSAVNGKASTASLSAHISNNSNPHGTNALQVGAIPDGNGTVNDNRLGARTANPATAPNADSGTLTQWVSWFANRIKAITGTATWRDTPATTLATAASHIANANNPHGTTAAQIGAISSAPGSVTDTHIGNRLVEDTLSPTGNEASLLTLLSWLANRIKAITGGANWRSAPATTLVAAAAHMAATNNPHGATPAQIGAPSTDGTGATGTWPISITGGAQAAPWSGLSGIPNAMLRSAVVVTGASQTAVAGNCYMMTADVQSTLTLPASPSPGDVVGFVFCNALATNILGNNGKPIMGVSENLVLNRVYVSGMVRFLDNTKGWRL